MKNWIFVLLFGASLIPFLNRPWLFDDPSVVITARAAAAHPLDPYHYTLDLDRPNQPNWPAGGYPAYTHPPLSAWTLGLVDHWSGDREWPLHLVFFVMAAIVLYLFYRMSVVFTTRRTTALYWFGFSPVIFLTSLVLYPHFFYLLFYELSLIAAWKAGRGASAGWGVCLGVALSLAALSLDQWPVLLILSAGAFWMAQRGREHSVGPYVLALLMFTAIYGSWCVWEIHLYGQTHLTAVFHVRAGGGHYPWIASFLPLIFLGGGLPFALIGWPVLWRSWKIVAGALAVFGMFIFVMLAGPFGGFTWHQALLMTLFFSTALAFLCALLWMVRNGTETDRILLMWFVVELAFAQKFLTYSTGHHLIEIAIPAALLAARLAERLALSDRLITTMTIGLSLLTLSVARADRSLAEIGPRLAQDVASFNGHLYYWGNSYSGFAYYLNRAGAQPYDFHHLLGPDEYLLVPHNFNVEGPLKWPEGQKMVYVATREYSIPDIWRTFSIGDSAGWYSASWGALPYAFSRQPAEHFTLLRGAPIPATLVLPNALRQRSPAIDSQLRPAPLRKTLP